LLLTLCLSLLALRLRLKGLPLRILGRLLLKVHETLLRWRLLLLVKVRKAGLLLLLLLVEA
jgi:hypothetical protein